MNIISWILFGVLSGLVTSFIDPNSTKGGVPGAILFGVIGALLGGLSSSILFGYPLMAFNISSFIIAVTGTFIVLVVGSALRKR
jgi:uncharacterized membrane protein YeaQ/YmgE (transglycosylase-associated protein family)